MITEAQIEAAAIAIFTAQNPGGDWSIQFEGVKNRYRRYGRLAIEAAERAAWRPIEEAEPGKMYYIKRSDGQIHIGSSGHYPWQETHFRPLFDFPDSGDAP